MDPFQFAYRSDRSCEDAILSIIDSVTSHLDPKAVSEKNKLKGVNGKSSNSTIKNNVFWLFVGFQHNSAASVGK